jgi:hypothetical protein
VAQRRAVQTQRRSQPSNYQGGQGDPPQSFGYQDARQSTRQAHRDAKAISPAAPTLAAQWIICMVLLMLGALTKPGEYLDKMSEVLWRGTAITALFFVLALASMSDGARPITKAFGWLVVGGILLKQVSTIYRTIDVVAGQGTGDQTDTLTADVKTTPPPHNILT